MSKQEYFQSALADFTFEAASGGAIRHLADLGYTVKQITQQLSFPTSCERVKKVVWDHLLETGVLLLEEPGSGSRKESPAYVVEHDKYGRTSFRQARAEREQTEKIFWKESIFEPERDGRLAGYLEEKCMENGEQESYIFCDFGRMLREKDGRQTLQVLNQRQRDYLEGFFQDKAGCYHRLDRRMREITVKLYETGKFNSCCYFMRTAEKILLGGK